MIMKWQGFERRLPGMTEGVDINPQSEWTTPQTRIEASTFLVQVKSVTSSKC
jgi:hypothetical protein